VIEEQKLRQGLQKLLEGTITAIRERLADEPSLEAKLRERHAAAVQAARTEGSAKGYTAFADDQITQAAVHWLLGCVFVRFLEDNGWLDERNSQVAWIAGPGERLALAKGRRTLFLRPDPGLTDRDYLLYVFADVGKLPGVSGLFDARHNPLYVLQPTAQGAARIVEFFQKVDPDTNELIYDFTDSAHGTRFLGDLYQNLSESARKRYALCQTPGFVIDFILDRTLTPALDTFGLATVRMIDPSCGSGHFLLEAFTRLIRAWGDKEPGANMPALVQRALDAVYGVDLNPFAVEITRFRLLIAALESSRIGRLKDAPNFKLNLAAGDSLLHGARVGGGGIQRGLLEDRLQHFYETEDADELERILGQTYHVVMGNPPYINVSDPVLRDAYRSRFTTCHGKYQLGVPFTERFFDLTVAAEKSSASTAGWIGMIVSNAFMKRTFGKKLIENFLRQRDLTHVIDTSGVYLPGHATPTAILIARHRSPVSNTIRAVRGIRGEIGIPPDPATAPVWREISDHIDQRGYEGLQVSVADADRDSFSVHPWALGGGGASELKEQLDESASNTLSAATDDIGVFGICAADDVMVADQATFKRRRLPTAFHSCLLTGEKLRDWGIELLPTVFFPYVNSSIASLNDSIQALRYMWPFRTALGNRATFSGGTYLSDGRPWWGWHQLALQRLFPSLSIAYSDVATHNNFCLDPGSKVFDRHAPIIKLSADATNNEYLELLGLLNSSTACFWLREVCQSKGAGGIGGGLATEQWEYRFEFDVTKLKQFPIPAKMPLEVAKLIQRAASARGALSPDKICAAGVPGREALDIACDQANEHLANMIALQEELDWQCYRLYGIIEDDLTLQPERVPPLKLGERSFEIVLARAGKQTTWFERHHSTPITKIPEHWPEVYRKLVERRITTIESNRDIALIERPECKRRWNLPRWEELEIAALKSWLLDRIEANPIWQGNRMVSFAELRDTLARDGEWGSVGHIYNGNPIQDLEGFVITLVSPEAVPFLPTMRYTDSGVTKRAEWEAIWKLQRDEDAGYVIQIPAPPKYGPNDFKNREFWRLRGGLDVPKERFILYSGLERDADGTSVLGWAGWNHLEQAQALAAYYQKMLTEEGWQPERLKPILAGLLDLREWLKQWHDQVDPETGLQLGTYFSEFAEAQCQELGFSTQEVLAWQPAATARRRERRTRTQ
jgi:hypothetical protein